MMQYVVNKYKNLEKNDPLRVTPNNGKSKDPKLLKNLKIPKTIFATFLKIETLVFEISQENEN